MSLRLLDILLPRASQPPANNKPSRDLGNSRKTPRTPSPYAKRLGMIALVIAVASIGRDSIAQTAKGSIDVPPHSRLLLQAVGSGDQVYGCVNGNWALTAPDAKLLNLSLDDTLRVLRGSSMMVVGSKQRPSLNKLLPMRPQCRGCCLSRSAELEDWRPYDLSSVPGRAGEMRLTAVVARAQ
jgi:hypothetical protein